MSQDKQLFALVKRIAASYAFRMPRHVDVDDLIGAGGVGLAEACQRRNGMSDDEFFLFASLRIRGAIIDEIRNSSPNSRHTIAAAKQLDAALMRAGQASSEDEVAAQIGINAKLLTRIQASRTASVVNSSPSQFPAAPHESPEELVAEKETVERVRQAKQLLPPSMRHVVEAKYEADDTQAEIARRLRVSEPRVSQIHNAAMERLIEIVSEQNIAA